MRKNNMKIPKEKEIIVNKYFNDESIKKLADDTEIGKRKIYNWVNKYQKNGLESLKFQTGKRLKKVTT